MLISEAHYQNGPYIQSVDPIRGFKLQDQWIAASLLLLPQEYQVLPTVPTLSDLPWDTIFEALTQHQVELLLIGIGHTPTLPPHPLLIRWQSSTHNIEWMQSGAACRTHAVVSQERTTALLLYWEN